MIEEGKQQIQMLSKTTPEPIFKNTFSISNVVNDSRCNSVWRTTNHVDYLDCRNLNKHKPLTKQWLERVVGSTNHDDIPMDFLSKHSLKFWVQCVTHILVGVNHKHPLSPMQIKQILKSTCFLISIKISLSILSTKSLSPNRYKHLFLSFSLSLSLNHPPVFT